MKLTAADKRLIITMREYKFTTEEIMKKLGATRWQVLKVLREARGQ